VSVGWPQPCATYSKRGRNEDYSAQLLTAEIREELMACLPHQWRTAAF